MSVAGIPRSGVPIPEVPGGGGTSLGIAACWWFIVILGSSSNGVGTGGVVAIAFCWYRAS